jgi:hypothetical protein
MKEMNAHQEHLLSCIVLVLYDDGVVRYSQEYTAHYHTTTLPRYRVVVVVVVVIVLLLTQSCGWKSTVPRTWSIPNQPRCTE